MSILEDEIMTDIDNFLQRTFDYISKKYKLDNEMLKEELEDSLLDYCYENNLSVDITKTVESFLQKKDEIIENECI